MVPRRRDSVGLAVLAILMVAGCGRRDEHADKGSAAPPVVAPTPPPPPPADAPTAPVAVDWYRAVIGSDHEEVPFFVSMPPPGTVGGCTIVNGDERIPVECRWEDATTIVLEFRMFATRIRAERGPDGTLSGGWQMSRIAGPMLPARFVATRIPRLDPTLRFPAAAATTPPAVVGDFSGTWKVQFSMLEAGKGMLTQTSDGVVTGTIIPRGIGDMRYLAGNARGTTLWLSTFDGQHAYVLRAELDPGRQALTGTWVFPQITRDRFTARRVATLDTSLVDKLHLRRGAKGVTVPQLDDPRYRGKPVIVDYFGTWCPACMDLTPFLVELYRRHHAAGLEIISIALEGTTDDAYNQQQVDYFRKLYAIPWPIVIVPGEYTEAEELLPPELEGTGGYPITIFLDRDRSVRGLHSGFFGPAAGEDHRRLKKTFEGYVEAMLAAP